MAPSESTPDATRPVDLHVQADSALHVRWADGRQSVLPLTFLRNRCPCATCRSGESADVGVRMPVLGGTGSPQAVRVASAELVGNYALKINWADGHSTGIYDFKYLRRLADELAAAGGAAND